MGAEDLIKVKFQSFYSYHGNKWWKQNKPNHLDISSLGRFHSEEVLMCDIHVPSWGFCDNRANQDIFTTIK